MNALAPHQPATITPQVETDERLVELWLHGRPENTWAAYRLDADRFLVFVGKPIGLVMLGDIQAYSDSLGHLAPATRARCLSVVKSLFSFGQRLGYLPLNVAAAVRVPTVKNTRAERILPESDVHRILALEPDRRNRTLLRLLYAGGLRVSELTGLAWRDLADRDDGAGQVTIYGKGGKTRVVLLPSSIYRELLALRWAGAGPDGAVFRSRKGGHLDRTRVERIVRAAARRAGVEAAVSPHWLRHAHASHALDRGAPISLVGATLGHANIATTGRYLHARPNDSSSRYLAV